MKALWGLILLLTAFQLMPPEPAFGQQEIYDEYEVKSAFIYNFTKFVEWPANVLHPSADTINLCVMGVDPFRGALGAIAGKTVRNRKLSVNTIMTRAGIINCHALFIASSEDGSLPQILEQAGIKGALTIGDTEGYGKRGVMINMIMENNRVRFSVNLDAVKRSGLRISSQLLKLASEVYGP